MATNLWCVCVCECVCVCVCVMCMCVGSDVRELCLQCAYVH